MEAEELLEMVPNKTFYFLWEEQQTRSLQAVVY